MHSFYKEYAILLSRIFTAIRSIEQNNTSVNVSVLREAINEICHQINVRHKTGPQFHKVCDRGTSTRTWYLVLFITETIISLHGAPFKKGLSR